MIVDKNKKPVPATPPAPIPMDMDIQRKPVTTLEEAYQTNALCEVYYAVRDIISKIRVDESNPDSEPYFKTIKMNNGQLSRIKNNKWNKEYALAFPAVFINFINVRYLVEQSRIGDGRAECRIEFVLNALNNGDDEVELEGYRMFQRINGAIMSSKHLYSALVERFRLTYFDQPVSMDDGVQPFWITYEVWFKDYSAYRYKDYVDCHIVVPPFTNHSDQIPEANEYGHSDHKAPTYDEASGFKPNL